MNIGIDARPINLYRGSGIGTYTENVTRELLNLDSKNSYTLYWYGTDYETFKHNNCKINIISRGHHNFFENCYLPYNTIKNNIDIYHIPQNGIGLSEDLSCIKVVTIHDLIPYVMPETVGKGYLLKFLKSIPLVVEKCDAIITVSEYSKKDLLKFFPINPDKIYVTPLAANSNYKIMDKAYCSGYLLNNYGIKNKFILYIGGFSPRKNVKALIYAFSKIKKSLTQPVSLVIVGSNKDDLNNLKLLCDKLRISKEVIFTGYVKESELPIFYNTCEVFAYPSLYEGFGLPPLEAMSCGAPVITSNITSIPEVVKDSGILIDPFKSSEIENALWKVLNDESLRNDLKVRGIKNSATFSWKKTAEKTLDIYNAVYKKAMGEV
ncbi:glycosyltransferase family 4 protein [Clostridium guangxiense]|uniref:glycosyltransferase family 4 protein n=1 Tax=Clostridium guangxiense TaxID=1662055 RepID=UPI001E4CC95B|nr:glycosyltransferase family 1 protein [Clostridium guangxiense]MCD2346677.1 glycosyltransferase family 4 protein [Clostridium guangxiense]